MKNKNNGLKLSLILPTYNESENIEELTGRLSKSLSNFDYEVIIVDDDSPDLTWQIAQDIGNTNKRIKTIRRFDKKGLSSAVMAGMLKSKGDVIAVMDADMQHDESILPKLCKQINTGKYDICVGSRGVAKGGYGEMSMIRKFASFFAKNLAHIALKTSVEDPMSGFFVISREYYEKTKDKVNPSGFKIALFSASTSHITLAKAILTASACPVVPPPYTLTFTSKFSAFSVIAKGCITLYCKVAVGK